MHLAWVAKDFVTLSYCTSDIYGRDLLQAKLLVGKIYGVSKGQDLGLLEVGNRAIEGFLWQLSSVFQLASWPHHVTTPRECEKSNKLTAGPAGKLTLTSFSVFHL